MSKPNFIETRDELIWREMVGNALTFDELADNYWLAIKKGIEKVDQVKYVEGMNPDLTVAVAMDWIRNFRFDIVHITFRWSKHTNQWLYHSFKQ